MIKVKNMFDVTEVDDGVRIWVEAHGLTLDLQEWCEVDEVLCHLGPPAELSRWFEDHPDGYDYFRATYHAHLNKSRYMPQLQHLAQHALRDHLTIIHQGDDPNHNTGAALHEFLSELQIYCPPDAMSE